MRVVPLCKSGGKQGDIAILLNPITLRMAKTLLSFCLSECNRVNLLTPEQLNLTLVGIWTNKDIRNIPLKQAQLSNLLYMCSLLLSPTISDLAYCLFSVRINF